MIVEELNQRLNQHDDTTKSKLPISSETVLPPRDPISATPTVYWPLGEVPQLMRAACKNNNYILIDEYIIIYMYYYVLL